MAKSKRDWLNEAEALGVDPLHEDMTVTEIREAIAAKEAADAAEPVVEDAADTLNEEPEAAKLTDKQRIIRLEQALTHLLRNEHGMAVRLMGAQR